MSELRKDPILDRWIIIAAERSKRPHATASASLAEPTEPCPFCAGHESETPPEVLVYRNASTMLNSPAWTLRVVPNKYPALADTNTVSCRLEDGYEFMDAVGVHEVIIESPEHRVKMAELSERQVEDVLRAYRQRITELQKNPRWQSILIYKNEGSAAGATLEHVHSQLLAMPMVPREVAEECRAAVAHYAVNRTCAYCELIDKESAHPRRMVAETDDFVVFCPFAPRFPFETWLMPKQHSPFFQTSADNELRQVARLLRDALQRIGAISDAPFNYVIHSAPLKQSDSQHYHWHLEILPRISKLAGFELASGYYINTVAPEEAARLLREVAL